MARRALLGLVLAIWVSSCIPGGSLPFFELDSATDPDLIRSYAAARPHANFGGSPVDIGLVAGDVGRVRYNLDDQKRAFLFEGDLSTGIESGGWLHLPQMDPGSTVREQDITSFDPSKWNSFRVYDSGMCSSFVSWDLYGLAFLLGIQDSFQASSENGRLTRGRLHPKLMALRGSGDVLSRDDDRIVASFRLTADHVGGRPSEFGIGCDGPTMDVDVEFAPERFNGAVCAVPQCLYPSAPGGCIQTADGSTFDFGARVVSLHASVSGCGAKNGAVAAKIEKRLRKSLPVALVRAIRQLSLRDPRTVGVAEADIRPCTCDTECTEFANGGSPYPGRRHVCHLFPNEFPARGECWVELEPDRVNLRPDGLEIVYAEEDTDIQWSLLDGTAAGMNMCSPTRNAISYMDPDPHPGDIPDVTFR